MTRARWVGVGVVGVLLAALLVVVGVDLPHAVIGGLVWVVGILLLVHLGLGQRVALPRLPFGRRDGTRTEVSSLSWALYGTQSVSPHGQRQLRRIATTALGEAGVDLGTPLGRERAAALLGSAMVAFLVEPDAPPPDARGVRAAVLALERMERAVPTTGPTPGGIP